jgi:hypothetical protein
VVLPFDNKHAISSFNSFTTLLALALALLLLLLLGRQLSSKLDTLQHLLSLFIKFEFGDDDVGSGETNWEGLAVGFVAGETFDVDDIYLRSMDWFKKHTNGGTLVLFNR